MERIPLTQDYKGYTISGDAQLVHGYGTNWCVAASVLLIRQDKLCIEVHRFQDRMLAYDDEDLAKWFGLFLAQIAVDHCLHRRRIISDPWILLGLSISCAVLPKNAKPGKFAAQSYM